MNSDVIADGAGTSMMILLYLVYGGIVLCGLINRKNQKIAVKKTKVFPVTAVIGIIASVFMIGYIGGYQFTIAPALDIAKNGNRANNLISAKSG